MQHIQDTLEQLGRKAPQVSAKQALVGLDGFVDRILTPISVRSGRDFVPMAAMAELGQRVIEAAGNSCNIELHPRMEKLGGNGPIMANALLNCGMKVRYIGALGKGEIHPLFKEFAARTKAVSLCAPGLTNALEFADGKVQLGEMESLGEICYEGIISAMGEGMFLDELSRCDLVAMTNWTMVPRMSELLEALLERALPMLPPKDGGRLFFFDLADPRKRSLGELRAALELMGRFRSHGRVTLGLNLSEARQVAAALDLGEVCDGEEALRAAASAIRRRLEMHCVALHPRDCAACATRDGSHFTKGPLCAQPLVSTGAGDHFNAGFATGQLLGLSPDACLTLAVAFSGQYVRTGQGPSLAQTDQFLRNWRQTA